MKRMQRTWLKAVCSLSLILCISSVNGSIFGRRSETLKPFGSSFRHLWLLGLLGSERCLTFQSSCVNYILNIALAYRIEGDKFRVQGWINLGAGETSEVKSLNVSALSKCFKGLLGFGKRRCLGVGE